jgi:hypothetical protein
MESKNVKFLKIKEDILDNLDILIFNLENCVDAGMLDDGSAIYNTLEDLSDQINSIDTNEELEEIISQAKIIERQIDGWMATQGQTSISLTWPTL